MFTWLKQQLWNRQLRSGSVQQRIKAALRLAGQGHDAIPGLVKALGNPTIDPATGKEIQSREAWDTRIAAAVALASYHRSDVIQKIIHSYGLQSALKQGAVHFSDVALWTINTVADGTYTVRHLLDSDHPRILGTERPGRSYAEERVLACNELLRRATANMPGGETAQLLWKEAYACREVKAALFREKKRPSESELREILAHGSYPLKHMAALRLAPGKPDYQDAVKLTDDLLLVLLEALDKPDHELRSRVAGYLANVDDSRIVTRLQQCASECPPRSAQVPNLERAYYAHAAQALEKIRKRHERRERDRLAGNFWNWVRSGEPKRWVEEHRGGWNHQDWLALLEHLKTSGHWPVDPDEVGKYLEGLKR